VASWLSSDIRKILNRTNQVLTGTPLTPKRLAALLELMDQGRISGKIAKNVLERIFEDDEDPLTVVEREGWFLISDPETLEGLVGQVMAEHPGVVEAVRNGDIRQKGWLMGQIMRLSGGNAAPDISERVLDRMLSSGT
jgi:aspartyl-tRNA(Asn)/glutamyl-tRNA(Gln) amidotransferase subunit B